MVSDEKLSGGKRNLGFRGGDRSEYLACFALSRIAFVWPVPRQEDYGVVDFACILSRDEGRAVFPESAFYVQVKSNTNDFELSKDASRWIARHLNTPLFIAIIDKKADTLTLFSCSRILRALILQPQPNQINFKFGAPPPNTEHTTIRNDGTGYCWTVYSGIPVFSGTLDAIEKDSDALRNVLDSWIKNDAALLANRLLNGVTATTFHQWETNEIPSAVMKESMIGPNYGQAEQAIAPVLTALAHNYRNTKNSEKLEAIRPFMALLREYLDDHGIGFVDGKIRIDD